MKRNYLLTAIAAMLLFISACSKKCPCAPGIVEVYFVGIDSTEADTVILRTYQKGNNFVTPTDTNLVTNSNSYHYQRHDTLSIHLKGTTPSLEIGNDYELIIPGINKTFRLNSFVEEEKEENCVQRNLHGCRNNVLSVKVNGIAENLSNLGGFATPLYLRR